jgi:hypothetical protein
MKFYGTLEDGAVDAVMLCRTFQRTACDVADAHDGFVELGIVPEMARRPCP